MSSSTRVSSDRPYRKALSIETVVEELIKYSGSQFDPTCVDAFLQLLEEEGEALVARNQKFDIYEFLEGRKES